VEADLKLDFDSKYAALERDLQERERRIEELRVQQSKQKVDGASKEADMR